MYHSLSVFVAAARLGFRQAMAEKAAVAGHLFLLAIIVLSYSNIYRMLPAEKLAANGTDSAAMTWYLTAVEYVLFCASYYWRETQNDIQSGQIMFHLLRPCPMWILKMGEWSGQYVARALVMLLPTLLIAAYASGKPELALNFLWSLVTVMPLAAAIYLGMNFIVGASSLWLGYAEPVWWICQKFLFFFGALLFPLALYPEILRDATWLTPFPAVMAASGWWISPAGMPPLLLCVAIQAAWTLATLLAVAGMTRMMSRRILNGGGG